MFLTIRRFRFGVTLVEIMVVSVIVGILSLLAMPAPGFHSRKNEELQLKSTLSTIRSALYSFQQDHFDFKGSGNPIFPTYDYFRESSSTAAETGFGDNSSSVKTLADFLESALLKPTAAYPDRRKKIFDFRTGYYSYPIPPNAFEVSKGIFPISDFEIEIQFSHEVQQKFSAVYFVEFRTPYENFPEYTAVFQWVDSSILLGLNEFKLRIFNNGISKNAWTYLDPLNCGSIISSNEYDNPALLDDGRLKVYCLPLLPPYLHGNYRTMRWDSPRVLDYYTTDPVGPGKTLDQVDLPPGFPLNPAIPPSSIKRRFLNPDFNPWPFTAPGCQPNDQPERIYWEAHVTDLDDKDNNYWVPLSLYTSEVEDLLLTARYCVDDIRFPSLDAKNFDNSGRLTFYEKKCALYGFAGQPGQCFAQEFFPLLDKNHDGGITDADRQRFLNVVGELYYWQF
ncbi:MAG: type II secretion system protein [Candidatus Wallbacteria bacterium]|nr:type II secretion system protein [Candidatus Wallbacteria bacterium]